MRILLLLFIWGLSMIPSLNAQNAQDVWAEMDAFVKKQNTVAIPNEKEVLAEYEANLLQEGVAVINQSELVALARNGYWQGVFEAANRSRLLDARAAASKEDKTPQAPLPNPDLGESCNLDIVVIIDRSGSISNDEEDNIRAGLLAFVQNLLNSGNTLTFVGMGERGAVAPIISPTVTYNPGTLTTHSNWINNTLQFDNACDQCDSWSTGLEAAAGFDADLVLMITDGNDDHDTAIEPGLTIAAANVLKSNGANGGNGAHIFVFGETAGGYDQGSLQAAVSTLISTGAVAAMPPPTLVEISDTDFIGFGNSFQTLSDWLTHFEFCCPEVTTTYIAGRQCVIHDFRVGGTLDNCPDLVIETFELQFWNNGNLIVTVDVTVEPNGNWSYFNSRLEMEALGIIPGNWYDVVPVVTFTNGTVISDEVYINGLDNEINFAGYSDPMAIVNDDANDSNTSMTQFCDGSSIFYHGTDPLSGNHWTAIKRKPIGSTGNFGEAQYFEWVNASLDDYTGNLEDQYPGYFQVGYAYELTIASHNTDPDVCIAWSTTTVEFEIIECCKVDANILSVPDCVADGEEFTVVVELLAPLSTEDIELIYSNNSNYTYVSHFVSNTGNTLQAYITFVRNTCTCEGEMLVFDIRLADCSEVIWVMTDNIPCCVKECNDVKISNWYAEDCIIVNGHPARYFCLEVQSESEILSITPATNEATCQVTLEQLEMTTDSTNNTTSICGYLLFEDPNCTGHAQVSIQVETKTNCCLLEQPFSFPGGCRLPEICLKVQSDIEIIYGTEIYMSISLPTGTVVNVYDVLAQNVQQYTVGTIQCAPFLAIPNGGVSGGTACNGIIIIHPTEIDCRGIQNPPISLPYHYEISWGKCSWQMVGDFCDELIAYDIDIDIDIEKRSGAVETLDQVSTGDIRVFPNPLDQSGILNFDLGTLNTPVTNIQVTDIYGKTIESFVPAPDQKVFKHQLNQPLSKGMYLLVFHLADGQMKSAKVVAME